MESRANSRGCGDWFRAGWPGSEKSGHRGRRGTGGWRSLCRAGLGPACPRPRLAAATGGRQHADPQRAGGFPWPLPAGGARGKGSCPAEPAPSKLGLKRGLRGRPGSPTRRTNPPRPPPTRPAAGRGLSPVGASRLLAGSAGAFACCPVFLCTWPSSPGFPGGQVGGWAVGVGSRPSPRQQHPIPAGKDPPAGQPEGAARRVHSTPGGTAARGTPSRTHFYWAQKPQALASPGVGAPAARLPHPRTACHWSHFSLEAPLRSHTPRHSPGVAAVCLPEASRAKAEQEGPPWQGWAGRTGAASVAERAGTGGRGVSQRPQAGKRRGAGL